MKKPQIIGIAIAAGAGLLAMVGMQTMLEREPKKVIESRTVNATKVLVARTDIGLGTLTSTSSFRWQEWPRDAVSPAFITYDKNRNAAKDMSGGVARSQITKGEPITSSKLIHAGRGGILAAILPAGKRAVSTSISEKSAVGKMILPNDHVDVILTRRNRDAKNGEEFVSDTLFRNIRVLAIGRKLEAKGDKKDAEGNVATLELTPRQAELLALANAMGEISLALRSIADITTLEDGTGDALKPKQAETSSSVNITRYGTTSRQYGLN